MPLEDYGWSAEWAASYDAAGRSELEPGRVIADHGQTLRVLTDGGEREARVAGSLSYRAGPRSDLPAVGDWVLAEASPSGPLRIVEVLPRRSQFVRKVPGPKLEEQVVAANVDVVAIVCSCDAERNPRRVERYLTIVWESGARPIVVLTKADLANDLASSVESVEAVCFGVALFPVSSVSGEGVDELRGELVAGETVGFLGSSGVGKSTLINRLAGAELARTAEVRAFDGKGRHTTTHRELLRTDDGFLLLDTPGMRELQLWDGGGLMTAFDDVAALAARCRFKDCAHLTEPDCAVLAAVADGSLADDRLDSYRRLLQEHRRVEEQRDVRGRQEKKRRDKLLQKAFREHLKRKDERRSM